MQEYSKELIPVVPITTQTVFIVLRKSDLLILGCFSDRYKAEKYINDSTALVIKELTLH
jgi:hypothetical protein